MQYNPEIYAVCRRRFAEKEQQAREDADRRAAALRATLPGLAEVDMALAATAGKIMDAIRQGKNGLEERLAAVQEENRALQEKKKELLLSAGYPADHTKPRYECALCNDQGYTDGKMCDCFKRALAEESIRQSGISHLLESESFENFSFDYYPDQLQIAQTVSICKRFANDLQGNLLLTGGTGLGKTHLSSAIVGRVIKEGHYAVYVTVTELIADYEYERFSRSWGDDSPSRTDKYKECELLVLDDFGTEVDNQFTASSLYTLLNDRLNRGLPTVISTNLSPEEIKNRYVERIASRILGEYSILVFRGTDIRQQKRRK